MNDLDNRHAIERIKKATAERAAEVEALVERLALLPHEPIVLEVDTIRLAAGLDDVAMHAFRLLVDKLEDYSKSIEGEWGPKTPAGPPPLVL